MEKRSVVLDDENVKTSSETKTCPDCGGELNPLDPRYCDRCGTKPWEKKPDNKEK